MVTVDPGVRARAADLEPLSPRAVAATLEQIDLLTDDVNAFVTCGDDDARAFAGRLPRSTACRPRALIVNGREASVLTGTSSPAEAAAQLAEVADIAAVTLGADGAVAVVDGRELAVDGCDCDPVDTTGAGDLFAAALAWGDLLGADPDVSLAWANLYAGLSVTAHTGTGGAVTSERLREVGRARGLPELPG
jgi:sugar/nucleoside kinase (ribokinase family)